MNVAINFTQTLFTKAVALKPLLLAWPSQLCWVLKSVIPCSLTDILEGLHIMLSVLGIRMIISKPVAIRRHQEDTKSSNEENLEKNADKDAQHLDRPAIGRVETRCTVFHCNCLVWNECYSPYKREALVFETPAHPNAQYNGKHQY